MKTFKQFIEALDVRQPIPTGLNKPVHKPISSLEIKPHPPISHIDDARRNREVDQRKREVERRHRESEQKRLRDIAHKA